MRGRDAPRGTAPSVRADQGGEADRNPGDSMSHEETPKLHIDSDWKAQAEAEKKRLADEAREREAKGGGKTPGEGELPPAEFTTLMSMLATQAIMGLGAVPGPEGKGVMIDLEGARFAIDLLGVLEEKTKGNLSDSEADDLKQTLAELRSRYVMVTKAVARQATGGDPAGGGGSLVMPS